MKTIKLLNLKLVNFKGIKEFDLDAAGFNAIIFGTNDAGKTSVSDAYSWLLINRSSDNKTIENAGIKTRDADGNDISHLDHEVEGRFLIDGTEVTLKKVYKEIWRKKTGETTAKHTGHTTDHYIDEVPVRKKDYDEYINSIVNIDKLPLLIDLWHFNDNVDFGHVKRREELFEIIGDITDEEIMKSNEELKELSAILGNVSVENHMVKVLHEQKIIRKRLEEIPSLIKENRRNSPSIDGSETEIRAKVKERLSDIEDKQEQINKIRSGSEVNEIKKEISDIELQIANVSNEHLKNEQQGLYKKKSKLQEEKSNQNIMRGDLRNLKQQISSNESRIRDFQEEMDELRKQGQEVIAREIDHDNECVCPTCEQDMPEGKVQEAVERFNINKSNELERINERGVDLKTKIEELQVENESTNKEIEKITKNGTDKTAIIERLKKEIKQMESNVVPIGENKQYIRLNEQKSELETKVSELEKSVSSSVVKVQEEIMKLKDEQDELQVELSKFEQVKSIENRNNELEEEEKEKAKEFEELERQKHLIDIFTRTKVSMVEGSINKHFKYVRFKLFEELGNGGLKDICTVTYDNDPYDRGLNHSNKYRASLDVINTLSKHYGVSFPIFIDNSESVVGDLETDNQLIRLVVSEKDKDLRIETKSEKESEVA